MLQYVFFSCNFGLAIMHSGYCDSGICAHSCKCNKQWFQEGWTCPKEPPNAANACGFKCKCQTVWFSSGWMCWGSINNYFSEVAQSKWRSGASTTFQRETDFQNRCWVSSSYCHKLCYLLWCLRQSLPSQEMSGGIVKNIQEFLQAPITTVAVFGSRFAGSNHNFAVAQLFDVVSGQVVDEMVLERNLTDGHICCVSAVTCSKDAQRIAIGYVDGYVRLVNFVTGYDVIEMQRIGVSRVGALALNSEGDCMAMWSDNGFCFALNTHLGVEVKSVFIGESWGQAALSFSPDGKYVTLACDESRILFFDFHSIFVIHEIKLQEENAQVIAFSPDGMMLSVAAYTLWHDRYLTTLYVLNIKTKSSCSIVRIEALVSSMTYSPNGGVIALGYGSKPNHGCVHLVRPDGSTIWKVSADLPDTLVFDPSGEILVASSQYTYTIGLSSLSLFNCHGLLRRFSLDQRMGLHCHVWKTLSTFAFADNNYLDDVRSSATGHSQCL